MFEHLEQAPADPILGLTAAFREDPDPEKINLGVGVYCDDRGETPVFAAVKEAETRLLAAQSTKNYLPIDGTADFAREVRKLLFGPQLADRYGAAAVTVQAPGGTGALRLAGDFLKRLFPGAGVWLSEPTWANHSQVFAAAGLRTATCPYFDSEANSLDFDAYCAALESVPAGDAVLLHGCCHNPTGVDPTPEQWRRIGGILAARGAVPLVDFAYQGLGTGIEEDAAGLRELTACCGELLVANSFSKNFGLYRERVGSLTALSRSPEQAAAVLSHLKTCARSNFSNPPAHGSAIVTEILQDERLRSDWDRELGEMRDRINEVRRLFVETLKERGADRDFGFIERQRGMFSFSGLDPGQVALLRKRHSIYIVSSGRINVAGITSGNIDRLCRAIAEVIAEN